MHVINVINPSLMVGYCECFNFKIVIIIIMTMMIIILIIIIKQTPIVFECSLFAKH